MKLLLATTAGLVAYGLLFTGGAGGSIAAPMSIGIGAIALLVAVEVSTRRLDTRRLALLAAIAALDAALRLALVQGIGGFSPVFFLILCAGYALGPTFGFLTGATALLVSALVTGGVGPWLPYEMFGCAWVGAIAGLAGAGREGAPRGRDLVVLGATGFVLGYAYGALVDVFDWAVFYRGVPDIGWTPGLSAAQAVAHYAKFYAVTSLVWDTFRAVGNVAMVVALGPPVLAALTRYQARFSLVIESGDIALAGG